MSRFDQGRWSRLVVWTGAALAWGSTLVAVRLEPGREEPPASAPATTQASANSAVAFPVPPEQGIVVIRGSGSATTPAPAPAAAPPPSLAPAPMSSGS